jgi:hypothetical protein
MESTMTKQDFLAVVEEELRLRGVPFERSALVEYIANMWPWIDGDSDVYRWAREFMKARNEAASIEIQNLAVE